ncbi:catechol 2,3-dioxygenase-like lactoylglutathione lyase family enzyme [Kribbella sp. VKM Ac-2571]|uniref:VOC family protein n=1 Tax=Kribbella sp. VKM Ac-2571 TaxID=2512222 RepID=UPI00105E61D3|nr:VOC family protein [Kribbella sp. VKM Ac-2571]TDO61074.1 catechol 2,3-dioxygenase-like lactoylglutathione lyase family enzyme [Kribbella sp. VKM Ac-2571]
MFDHLSLQCDDLDASRRFYEQALGPLGIAVTLDFGDVLGLAGRDGVPKFWLGRQTTGGVQREIHVAFTAPDRATVGTVHRAAVDLGAEVLHEPKEWPEYHPGYYAVFLRDPDGNNVEVVSHS